MKHHLHTLHGLAPACLVSQLSLRRSWDRWLLLLLGQRWLATPFFARWWIPNRYHPVR